MFDKNVTACLKGLAILFIVIAHLNGNNIKFLDLPSVFNYGGGWGVTIFLIVSGFGLSQSFIKHGLESFVKKRFSKVYVPYVIVTVIWLMIDMVFLRKTYSAKTVILSLLGIDLNSSVVISYWFVSYIIFWYVIFYCSARFLKNKYLQMGFILVVAAVVGSRNIFSWLYFFQYPALTEKTAIVNSLWRLYAYSFPLGVMLGFVYRDLERRTIFVLMLISLLGFAFFVTKSGEWQWYFRLSNTLLFLGLTCALMLLKKYATSFVPLTFIGGMSYEIYLFERVLEEKYSVLHLLNSRILSGLLFATVLVLASVMLRKTKDLRKTNPWLRGG